MNRIFRIGQTACFVLVAQWGMAQNCEINLTLHGVPDDTHVTMFETSTHKTEPVFAEGQVKDEKVVLKGNVEGPRMFAIQLDSIFGSFKMMLDKQDIVKVNADVKQFQRRGKKYCNFNNLVIQGSKTDSLYGEKIKVLNVLDEKQKAMGTRYKQLMADLRSASSKSDTATVNRLMAGAEYKQLLADNEALVAHSKEVIQKMITDNKDSWWAPFFMMDSGSFLTKDDVPTYQQLSDVAKNSYYGKLVAAEIFATKLNKPMLPFQVTLENGTKVNVGEYMKGKKYVLLDFWASWCAPCRHEIPNLKKQYELYKEKGLEIISISIDTKKEAWKKALAEERFTWPNFLDNGGEIAKLYDIKYIPMMYLIDEKGVLIDENLRGENLINKLKELFK